jgi:phospholipase/carboxylesterase
MGPFGYQWFSLQDRSMATMLAGVRAAAPMLDAFIDDALAERGLGESDLALIGFSQGTMMSLFVGPRRAHAVAGIIGYSGALVGADLLPAELRSRPRVLLVHGEADPVVPYQAMAMAKAGLTAAGIPVETLARPGLGHGIDEEGLVRGGRFLKETLG